MSIRFYRADMDTMTDKMTDHYNNDVCGMQDRPKSNVELLIMITGTKFDDINLRNKVRTSWGVSNRTDVRIIFYLIKHEGHGYNEVITPDIESEMAKHHDIMYINDSDNQPIYRALTSLKWVDTNCSNAKYLLKVDRSTAVNVPAIMDFVYSIPDTETDTVWGRVMKKKIIMHK